MSNERFDICEWVETTNRQIPVTYADLFARAGADGCAGELYVALFQERLTLLAGRPVRHLVRVHLISWDPPSGNIVFAFYEVGTDRKLWGFEALWRLIRPDAFETPRDFGFQPRQWDHS